ncbi:MAG: DUF429 domain-containing protein [Mobilicoccus sp.]|nr:DUF429 domain-containing protein [Mobilicoccus sp.]
MRTVGIDLAAETARTAMAVLIWADGRATVSELHVGVDDEVIREAAREADKLGVDCPIGWPTAFVEVVTAHQRNTLSPPVSSGRDWRRTLAWRATDVDVHARTGLTPLSVSADRIAHAAMRWAAIEAALREEGHDCNRSGTGLIAEVYPAAALKLWGLPHRGYKRAANVAARHGLVDLVLDAAPWLDLGPHEETCRDSDDALDAVLCALVARAVAVGLTHVAPADAPASIEGWIHLPTTDLAHLSAHTV